MAIELTEVELSDDDIQRLVELAIGELTDEQEHVYISAIDDGLYIMEAAGMAAAFSLLDDADDDVRVATFVADSLSEYSAKLFSDKLTECTSFTACGYAMVNEQIILALTEAMDSGDVKTD